MVPRIAPNGNLNIPTDFLRKRLTKEQATLRLQILNRAKVALEQSGQQLSPRSSREQRELSAALSMNPVSPTVAIRRDNVSQFYFVELTVDQSQAVAEKYQEKRREVDALNRNVPNGCGLKILQVLNLPSEEIRWYSQALEEELALISKDNSLLCIAPEISSINLDFAKMRSASTDPTFQQIIQNLYMSSSDLFRQLLLFNECYQQHILTYAREAQRALTGMSCLLEGCGIRLKLIPADFSTQTQAIVVQEAEKTTSLFQGITTSLDALMA